MTLTEFLLARIAEDEAVARAAGASTDGASDTLRTSLKEACRTGGEPHGPRGTVETTPARVLAECEAKRRIIDYREQCARDRDEMLRPLAFEHHAALTTQLSGLDAVLRALALPYASHPDYDETWRP